MVRERWAIVMGERLGLNTLSCVCILMDFSLLSITLILHCKTPRTRILPHPAHGNIHTPFPVPHYRYPPGTGMPPGSYTNSFLANCALSIRLNRVVSSCRIRESRILSKLKDVLLSRCTSLAASDTAAAATPPPACEVLYNHHHHTTISNPSMYQTPIFVLSCITNPLPSPPLPSQQCTHRIRAKLPVSPALEHHVHFACLPQPLPRLPGVTLPPSTLSNDHPLGNHLATKMGPSLNCPAL